MSITKKLLLINIFLLLALSVCLLAYVVTDYFCFRYFAEAAYSENFAFQEAIYEAENELTVGLTSTTYNDFANALLTKGYYTIVKNRNKDQEIFFNLDSDMRTKYLESALRRGDRLTEDGVIVNDGVMIFVIIDSADSNITYNIIDLEFTSLSSYRTQQNIYLLALLSFLFIIVIFVVVKESKEMVKPIQTLSEASHQMMRGDLDTDIKTEYRDEMGGLYKDFDKLRQTLKDNRVERERMAKDREEYIAGITHDLKTPLTSILGFSKGLLDGVAYTKEKTKKYLTVIYDTALHMNGLIEKLKDFSSLDSEKLEFKFERTNIVDFVNSFVSKTALQYMAKDVTVTSRMGIPLISQESSLNDFICMIDVEEFTRVLSNIINNTAKYKHAGMAYSEIVVSRGDGQVIITIKDDGPGVKEKELESIFDCFYRGDSSRTRPTEGSGLGLYVVAKIVAAHNGTVKAVNDNGLKIIITLPEVKK